MAEAPKSQLFSSWFQIIATALMSIGVYVLTLTGGRLDDLASELQEDRKILTRHLIDHPNKELENRINLLQQALETHTHTH